MAGMVYATAPTPCRIMAGITDPKYMTMKRTFLFLALFACLFVPAMAADGGRGLKLWYTTPADASAKDDTDAWTDDVEWLKSLPLGNGSLGAMVFGDVPMERIQLNEETMWSGSPQHSDNPEAAANLQRIRQLLFSGKYREATELTNRTQVCVGAGSGHGNGKDVPYGSFQTLGDLWIDFECKDGYTDYYRDLDLEKAVATVSYTQNGVKYRREAFISHPDQVMVVRMTADRRGALSFTCRMTRPESFSTSSEDGQLIMRGALDDGKGGTYLNYMARLKAVARGGEVSCSDDALTVSGADEVILLLAASTDYRLDYPLYKGRDYVNITRRAIESAERKSYSALLKAHLKEYTPYFGRVSLNLGDADTDEDDIPTDERLERVKRGGQDNRLCELVFQYGRYLLISSSRPGTMPANLQGIWANKVQTPWNGDYHTNVNIQMNYWPAEVANLSECQLPLFDLIASLVEPGHETARVQYGMDGWVVHPITNIWGYTSPGESSSWGMHPGGTGWLCQHIGEHYRFTGDKAFLQRMYPVLKGAVEFYLDWLTTDPKTGKLVSGPAASPENSFVAPDGSHAQISMGPTHDQQVIWQLFDDFGMASRELGVDDALVRRVAEAKDNLAPTKIGHDGRIMEWAEEFEEVEPGHRHISHLFAVHPGAQINMLQTPALAEAAGKSMDYRIAHGGGHTGWSSAWLIIQYSRLMRGEQAKGSLDTVLRRCVMPNLFMQHPPFQMDANFGTTAGIAEMLLQSHVYDDGAYVLQLLPALPDAWPDGEFSGLKARGGFEVSAKWREGHMVELRIKSLLGNDFRVWYDGGYIGTDDLGKGKTWVWHSR